MKNKIDIKNPRFFDIVVDRRNYHCNIMAVAYSDAWNNYICKDDAEPWTFGSIVENEEKRIKKNKELL